MRIKKLNFADAFLVFPGQTPVKSKLSTFAEERNIKMRCVPTQGGATLVFFEYIHSHGRAGTTSPIKVAPHVDLGAPYGVPLKRHRSAYVTGTALWHLMHGHPTYTSALNGEPIELTGRFPRTRNRVIYADRIQERLTVDIIGR